MVFGRLAVFLIALLVAGQAHAAAYRLQPGDRISVSVWQDSDLDRELVVAPDGMISFPLVGQVRAGGNTIPTIERILREKLQPSYVEELNVTVMLTNFERPEQERIPPVFYVTGEVKKPGPYALEGRAIDIVQAIALSGGFDVFAATRRIIVRRQYQGQEFLYRFNYRDFISGRDFRGNIRLQPGDVVVVPEKGLFGF